VPEVPHLYIFFRNLIQINTAAAVRTDT
jgi:hypothetical protein